MKTLNSYINSKGVNEGFYKNVGADDLTDIIKMFIQRFIWGTNGHITSTSNPYSNASYISDISPKTIYKDLDGNWCIDFISLLHDSGCHDLALIVADYPGDSIDKYTRIFSILEKIHIPSRSMSKINVIALDEKSSNDPYITSLIKEKFTKGFKLAYIKGLKSFSTFPPMQKKMGTGEMGDIQIYLLNGLFTSLDGCPDCSNLILDHCGELMSLTGSYIKLAKDIGIFYCPNIKTYDGAPTLAKGAGTLNVIDSGDGNGWGCMIPNKCTTIKSLQVPMCFFEHENDAKKLNVVSNSIITIYIHDDKDKTLDEVISIFKNITCNIKNLYLSYHRGDSLKKIQAACPNIK